MTGQKSGPPFAVTVSELSCLFEERGFKLIEREKPANSVPRRRGAEELLLFQKVSASSRL
jgi:hypothetical protein